MIALVFYTGALFLCADGAAEAPAAPYFRLLLAVFTCVLQQLPAPAVRNRRQGVSPQRGPGRRVGAGAAQLLSLSWTPRTRYMRTAGRFPPRGVVPLLRCRGELLERLQPHYPRPTFIRMVT